MKKRKLSLSEIKVQSFVTNPEKVNLIGGADQVTPMCFVQTLNVACLSDRIQSLCGSCGVVCTD